MVEIENTFTFHCVFRLVVSCFVQLRATILFETRTTPNSPQISTVESLSTVEYLGGVLASFCWYSGRGGESSICCKETSSLPSSKFKKSPACHSSNWSKKDSILSHICLNSIGGSRVDYEKSLLVADFNDKNLRKYQATTPVLAKAHAVSAQRTQWYSPSPKSVVLKTCGKRHSQIKVHHEIRCCVCVCVSLTCDWMDFLSFF